MPVVANDAPIKLLGTRLGAGGNLVTTWRNHQGRRVNIVLAPGMANEQGIAHARQFLHTKRQEALSRVRHV